VSVLTRLNLMLLSCALVVVSGCGSSPAPSPSGSAAVAVVRTTVITRSQFDVRLQSALTTLQQGGAPTSVAAMVNQVRASVLRSLILDTIIAQDAAAAGIAATPAQVQAQVAADAHAVGGTGALQTQLAEAGGSLAQLEDEIRSQFNEQRLENLFAEQRAALVEQRLGGGADFSTLAKEMSDDTGTSARGGDLGTITSKDFSSYDSAFIREMKALTPGGYSKTPVHDAGGYDILLVYARTAAAWKVRHILVAAPKPYTVTSRPAWFAEALFATVAQLCSDHQIHVYITDAGADPCKGAPALTPTP
jgi:parvulin-like peptidyl-prolyl isomerase